MYVIVVAYDIIFCVAYGASLPGIDYYIYAYSIAHFD